MKSPEISCCCWATSALIVLLSIELVISPKVVCAEGFESGLELPQSASVVRRFRSKRLLHIHDFGAAGDGVQNDTQALEDAWEIACSSPKRSRIIVPAGTYLVHPIVMSGPCRSKITFSPCRTAPTVSDSFCLAHYGDAAVPFYGHLNVYAIDSSLILQALTFHRCKDLKVENLSIGSLGKSNSTDFVESVSVDGALLSNTKNGLRIKTWQGGSGKASDINFQNVHMQNVSNPIIIDQFYCDSKLPCANQTKAVKVQDVSFKHIKGTSVTREAIRFSCSECSPCEGLYLEVVQLSLSTEGGVTESFCWEAYGTSGGSVFPPPCFSSDEQFIRQIIPYQRISLFNLRR
ncbi:Probable polygalacturonase At1g80170 [Linum perenne]